jgi:hypothetical protein
VAGSRLANEFFGSGDFESAATQEIVLEESKDLERRSPNIISTNTALYIMGRRAATGAWIENGIAKNYRTFWQPNIARVDWPFKRVLGRGCNSTNHLGSPRHQPDFRKIRSSGSRGFLAKLFKVMPSLSHRTAIANALVTTGAPPMVAAPPTVMITINYSPVIHDASSSNWVKTARQHASDLMRIIEEQLRRRARLVFD